jgi:hypothetical protein
MSILTKRLLELVSVEYPTIDLPKSARFLPMYSLDHGELSTTAAVEIAKATRQNAARIADALIAGLSKTSSAEWRNDNGYIVCSNMSTEELLSEVPTGIGEALSLLSKGATGSAYEAGTIWCLVPDNTEPVYARIRLLARAALQVLLIVNSGGRVTFRAYPLPGKEVKSVADLIDLFSAAVEWILAHEGERRREVEVPVDNPPVAIWTSHHYHERLDQRSVKEIASLRISGSARVTMPEDGWLLSRDRALSEILSGRSLGRVIEKLVNRDKWARFLFHAASTIPSGDFDPAVALFDECSSPLWSMRALMERYSRFSELLPLPINRDKVAQSIRGVKSYRNLLLSGLFLPVYTARAIAHNEVQAWCEAFERLSREGHAFINAPATRLSLERGLQDEMILEIAAGLGFGVSCIVPVVRVMEGRCAGQ